MASIDTLTAAIRATLAGSRHVLSALGVSTGLAEELRDRLAALGVESRSAQAASIVSDLEEAQAQSNAIIDRLEAALAAAEAARGLKNRTSRGSSEVVGRPTPDMHHRKYDPDKAKPIVPFVGRRKTVGALYIGGRRVGDLLWSGEVGPAADTEGVKSQWALKSSVRTHTEGHAAAVMRSAQTVEAEIYINRAVCDVAPDGCIQRIPEVLPPGCTLRVFDVTRPQARPIILKGTGEGLADDDQ